MTTINQSIDVNAYYFAGNKHSKIFPKVIQYNDHNLTFIDGMQYLVKQGTKAFKIFDMTDGHKTYRLRSDGSNWTLLKTKNINL